MCLYPKYMINKKYTATQKNGGCIPPLPIYGSGEVDSRVMYIQVPCGNCIECRKQKANEWRQRMHEELKVTNYPYFVTLTFSPEELKILCQECNLKECNAVAGKAVRRMLERYRKRYKKQLKHWFITELGHENTERIHMHGIIFSDTDLTKHFKITEMKKNGAMCNFDFWKYGNVFLGDFCNEQSVNYIVKYINKIDTQHKSFKGQIFCSPGIGRCFIDNNTNNNKIKYSYEKNNSKTYYTLPNGSRTKLSTYYKNKLYNEDERELIWRDSMDQGDTFMLGICHSQLEKDPELYSRLKDRAQETNLKLGYGSDSKEWQKKDYNITKNMIKRWTKDQIKMEAEKALNKSILDDI